MASAGVVGNGSSNTHYRNTEGISRAENNERESDVEIKFVKVPPEKRDLCD